MHIFFFLSDRVGSDKPKSEVTHTSRTVRRTKSGHNISEVSSYEESSSVVRKSRQDDYAEEVTSRSSRKSSKLNVSSS